MCNVFWFRGSYTTTISGYYGGITRSENAINIILNIITNKIKDSVNLIQVNIKPIRKRSNVKNNLELPLTYSGIIMRGILKILNKIHINSISLEFNSIKCKINPLLNIINEGDIIIFDGLKSYATVKNYINYLKFIKKNRVIYLSHNFEPDFFGKKNIIFKLEKHLTNISDIILTSSYRDFLSYIKYYKIDKEKLTILPNIFPTDFKLAKKSEPKIAVILGDHWGLHIINSLVDILTELNIGVISIGKTLTEKLKNKKIDVEGYDYIPTRKEFLETLSKAQIGINYAIGKGGTNVRKYDYALSGLVVLSSPIGARGEPLPYEYVFIDTEDFKTKIKFLLENDLNTMGEINRQFVLSYFKICQQELSKCISSLLDK